MHIGALIAAYLLGAVLGFGFLLETWTSTVWPPSGISLASLFLGGYRLWPGVAIGSFLANAAAGAQRGVPLSLVVIPAACIAVGNVVQTVVAVWLVRRATGPEGPLDRAQNVLAFFLLGPMLSTVISATVGTTALCASNLVPWDRS